MRQHLPWATTLVGAFCYTAHVSIIDDYLSGLSEDKKAIIKHMYDVVRHMMPDTTEELCYAMPALKYKNKALIAIMANKTFLSLYPFGAIERLGVGTSAFEQTSGSIHFTPDKPIPDELLKAIVGARKRQIEG